MSNTPDTHLCRPGIMIVNPRLHDPTPSSAALFLRWTKIHFRDLLNIPATPQGGKITRTLRFTAPHESSKYSHANEKESPYFYTILTNDINLLHTPAYYAVSRRLDLEATRALNEGEEAVGCAQGSMVWEVCHAAFTVYDYVDTEIEGVAAFQTFSGTEGTSCLVGFGASAPDVASVKKVQAAVVQYLKAEIPGGLQVYSSVYRNAGTDAQPDKHPCISKDHVSGAEWLVLVLVVDGVGETLKREHLEGMLEEWSRGRGVKAGVWTSELNMA